MSTQAPRVLFLTTDVPRDGETGGQIASWRLLQAYNLFAQVDVLALAPPGAKAPAELRELAANLAVVPLAAFHYRRARLRLLATLARSWVGGTPYRIAKFRHPEVRRMLAAWLAQADYDLLHCERLATTQYAGCVPGAPFVFYDHEVESHDLATMAGAASNPLVRTILRLEARRTHRAETAAVRQAAHVFAISEEDAELLGAGDPGLGQKVSVCPIPMPDAQPVARRATPAAFTALVLGPLHAGGRLDGLRWLLSSVWPGFHAAHPDARLLVVGAGAPRDIEARDGHEGIEVRGYVEDLDGVLAQTDVCLMPLLSGGGIRIKVLELLPRGVPCLGSRVAVRGFGGVEGVIEANSPEEWRQALIRLAREPGQARQAALAGAETLRSRYSLEATAQVLRAGFERAQAARLTARA